MRKFLIVMILAFVVNVANAGLFSSDPFVGFWEATEDYGFLYRNADETNYDYNPWSSSARYIQIENKGSIYIVTFFGWQGINEEAAIIDKGIATIRTPTKDIVLYSKDDFKTLTSRNGNLKKSSKKELVNFYTKVLSEGDDWWEGKSREVNGRRTPVTFSLVKKVLDLGVNVNKKGERYGKYMLWYAIQETNDMRIVRLLIEKGANTSVENYLSMIDRHRGYNDSEKETIKKWLKNN